MNRKTLAVAALALSLAGSVAFAQTAHDDMDHAGHETKMATKHAANGTKKATVKSAKTVKHDTAVGATKTARGTKTLAKKITGDKSRTTTPHDPAKPGDTYGR